MSHHKASNGSQHGVHLGSPGSFKKYHAQALPYQLNHSLSWDEAWVLEYFKAPLMTLICSESGKPPSCSLKCNFKRCYVWKHKKSIIN